MDNIGQILKAFREKTKIKMPEIAISTGIPKETLYKWEKGKACRDFNRYNKLKSYLDKKGILHEEEQLNLEIKKTATLYLPFDSKRPATPQIDGALAAGTIDFFIEEPVIVVERINAAFLGAIEGLIEVTENSMEPTYANGCRIGICRLNDIRILDWGYCYYFIDKKWKGIIRRVYQGETEHSIQLVADNPDKDKFPTIQQPWDQIATVFQIIACIMKL